MVPATAPERRPAPTKDAKLGSWPDPPPETMETCEAPFLRYMILFAMSHWTEGLVWGMLRRAVLTRWVGSCMKCFAVVC
jgi:hypothetical protein